MPHNDDQLNSRESQHDRSASRRRLLYVAGACVVSVALVVFLSSNLVLSATTRYRSEPGAPTGFESPRPHEDQHEPGEGDDHPRLKMVLDLPGVSNPELGPIADTKLPKSSEIVGVTVGDQSYAFLLAAMGRRTSHVVNLSVGSTPLSVSYCNKSQCIRVLTSDEEQEVIDLRVGGLDKNDEMVLLLADCRYTQSSSKLPLMDLPFERTTLKKWAAEHPGSMIFTGDASSTH